MYSRNRRDDVEHTHTHTQIWAHKPKKRKKKSETTGDAQIPSLYLLDYQRYKYHNCQADRLLDSNCITIIRICLNQKYQMTTSLRGATK